MAWPEVPLDDARCSRAPGQPTVPRHVQATRAEPISLGGGARLRRPRALRRTRGACLSPSNERAIRRSRPRNSSRSSRSRSPLFAIARPSAARFRHPTRNRAPAEAFELSASPPSGRHVPGVAGPSSGRTGPSGSWMMGRIASLANAHPLMKARPPWRPVAGAALVPAALLSC